MEEALLTPNPYSRPQDALTVTQLYVHYTANPGTSARQNRDYFEGLAQTGLTSASAHFVIGYEGEIVQCIPLNEMAYAVIGKTITRFPLNAAIWTRTENLRMQPISPC